MRKDFGSKSWVYPMPSFIVAAYDENGQSNAMNAAWGGIYANDKIGICIAKGHKTTADILVNKAFTVSMATVDQLVACDYVGIESGNKVANKMEKAGFHTEKSTHVNAPIIVELPMTVECELLSYDEENEFMIGKIVNVSADERVLDVQGNIDPLKLQPILFDPCHMSYLKVGEKVGNAFQDGKQLK